MHVVVTGANGFVARALISTLIRDGLPDPHASLETLTLMDVAFSTRSSSSKVRYITDSIANPAAINQAFDRPVDIVYHLASVPAGASESDYDRSRQVNLDATLLLLEQARAQAQAGSKTPVFVFSSSIATLGGTFGDKVDDDTPIHPELTYGYQKAIGELLVADYTRRGWIDGRSVRLAGIVVRPSQRTGQLSAFMSDIIRELSQGRSFVCPVSPKATCWLMSVPCVVNNLVHAGMVSSKNFEKKCTWTLPALRVSMEQLVNVIAETFNVDAHALIKYQPQPELEANFGRYPLLFTPAAEALGFHHDGDIRTLVTQALSLDD